MRGAPSGPARRGDPRSPKLRVHVQGSTRAGDLFAVSREAFESALYRHQPLARSIAPTFGTTARDLVREIGTAEVLLSGTFEVPDLCAIAPHLRWIQLTHAGVEGVAPLIPCGVTLTNAGGVDAAKAGEFVIGAVIMLNAAFFHFFAQQGLARWSPLYTSTLADKTILVLGTGNLGQAVAREARHFGMRVFGVSRTGQMRPGFHACATAAALPDFLPHAEFLICTLPDVRGTQKLIGRQELDLLPRSASVINIGRAGAIDYDALREKLLARDLAGAILDVFPAEPLPPDSRFWAVPNLLITPHCAIDDATRYIPNVLDIFFDNLSRYLDGRSLRNVVDLRLGY